MMDEIGTRWVHMVHSLGRLVRRYRATLATLGAMLAVAAATRTLFASLDLSWRAVLGVSPADIWGLRWRRIATSPLVTDGRGIFWFAVSAVAVAGTAAERRWGSRRVLVLFWGSHALTMLCESLVAALLLRWSPRRWRGLFEARDVGPSAAYFGVLGYLSAHLPRPWHAVTGTITTSVLAAVCWRPYRAGVDHDLRWLADIAHLIAFPLGWLFALVKR